MYIIWFHGGGGQYKQLEMCQQQQDGGCNVTLYG